MISSAKQWPDWSISRLSMKGHRQKPFATTSNFRPRCFKLLASPPLPHQLRSGDFFRTPWGALVSGTRGHPKEVLMRILALAILTIGMVSIGPAAAQTYDP